MLNPKEVQYLVIHCSNSLPSENLTAADLERQHRAQGCLSIKYHFVIRRDGTLEAGRPLDQIGLHANKQYNKCSVGICLVGGMGRHVDKYTDEQYWCLRRVAEGLLETFPNAQLVGWSDLSPSPNEASPHFNVKEWWEN